ncbi:unnamed protein product [Tilletia controversa]|nr:unnamed protein product [Tilletia controversa]
MKSFTALVLIGILAVIGTVKAKKPESGYNALIKACEAMKKTCTNPTDDRKWQTFDACMCKNWTMLGNGDCIQGCRSGKPEAPEQGAAPSPCQASPPSR